MTLFVRVVNERSMTFSKCLQKLGLWTFRECPWPVNDTFEDPLDNCHWPVNDSLGASPKNWIVDSYKLSFTSQWHFLNILLKTVIDWSMTLLRRLQKLGLWTFTNCHWPVNDTFWTSLWKVSLTSQWQFRSVSKNLDCGLLQTVIDQSMTV